jgi:hypothetical protein
MSGKTIVLCTALIVSPVLSKDLVQAQTRTTRPNDLGGEALGKAGLLSFSYQRMIIPWAGLQVGFFGGENNVTGDKTVVLPLGVMLYPPLGGNKSPFVTAGINLQRGPAEPLGPIVSEAYPFVGLGYESRSDSGFLFRATLYALFYGEEFALRHSNSDFPLRPVTIWPGFYFGYAF